ncbi:hypothetical protein SAMN05660964_01554 [Thiothrix caldifontis]|uniref:Uncharacterized protein n=1 Tax=Thiothrix caldifontis TaxID=525918 RepID=A0A1H4B0T9_9GAMM|nr:hypothetical protein [Thiothrix caldifontis]SEA41753.1 hypothetical protein SAMN05660964_01554 [Thiothrix caldifontis]
MNMQHMPQIAANHNRNAITLMVFRLAIIVSISFVFTSCATLSYDDILTKQGWSVTKVMTVNHFGSPSENDGFRPESFLFEKELDSRRNLLIGYVENSKGRSGPTIGYSKTFYQNKRFTLAGKVQVTSNYEGAALGVIPIPLMSTRYHLSKKIDVMLDAVPVPGGDEPFVLVITGINIDF